MTSPRLAFAAAVLTLFGAAVFLFGGCAATRGATAPRWEPIVVWEGEGAVERVRAAKLLPTDPTPSLVGVDQIGDVVLVTRRGGALRAERIYRHGVELTGIAIVDLDPASPGSEIYVGGFATGSGRDGQGGAVVRLAAAAGGYRADLVYRGPAYVHALEPAYGPDGRPIGLFAGDYDGALTRLTPRGVGVEFAAEVLYREPPEIGVEDRKTKDLAVLQASDGRPSEAVMVMKTGRCLAVDPAIPGSGRPLFHEPGGLSRILATGDGGFFVTGYAGRVLRVRRSGLGAETTVLHVEAADSGLRGVVAGRFPAPGGDAQFAIHGFLRSVRVLRASFDAYDAATVFRDVERGHALEAADLFPDDGADEIVVGGYSKRITVLRVARGV